jgi:hypothetical protein
MKRTTNLLFLIAKYWELIFLYLIKNDFCLIIQVPCTISLSRNLVLSYGLSSAPVMVGESR